MNVPIPKLRNTFWVHGLLLGLAMFVIAVLPIDFLGLTTVKERLAVLIFRLGEAGLVLVFAPLVFPIFELLLQQSHLGAYYIASRKFILYRVITSVFAVSLIFGAIIMAECLLFLFIEERFPLDFGPISFWSGWWRTMLADLPLVSYLMAGELLRQVIYNKRIRSHYALMRERIKEV